MPLPQTPAVNLQLAAQTGTHCVPTIVQPDAQTPFTGAPVHVGGYGPGSEIYSIHTT